MKQVLGSLSILSLGYANLAVYSPVDVRVCLF